MTTKASPPARVLYGALLLLDGTRRTVSAPRVRATYGWLLLSLFLFSLAINALGLYFVWELSSWSSQGSNALTFASTFAKFAARLIGVALVLLASPLLAISLCNLLFPLFSDLSFMAGMRVVSPGFAEALEAGPGLGTLPSIAVSLRRLVGILPIMGACFLLGFVPGLGPLLAPPILLYFLARSLGRELLDPYFDRRGLSWQARKVEVSRLSPEVLGLGLLCAPLLGVPLVGPMFFGALQAGSAHFVEKLFGDSIQKSRHS